MGYAGSHGAFAQLVANSGRLGIRLPTSPQKPNTVFDKLTKWFNPEFTGPQHVNPNQVGAGGITTANQATPAPKRRQGGGDDGTMITGQASLGASTLLGG